MILAENGEKMSKSKGNVINPDQVVEIYGADTLRLYEMFMGPFDQQIQWDTKNIIGARRFIEKLWRLKQKVSDTPIATDSTMRAQTALHVAIKKVSEDIETTGFNTAIAALMILVNQLEKEDAIEQKTFETLLQITAPFVPHVTEELWNQLGHKESIHREPWPVYDPNKLASDTVTIIVQINSKNRETLTFQGEPSEDQVTEDALKLEKVAQTLEGKSVKRMVYVKNKLLNIVV